MGLPDGPGSSKVGLAV